MPPKKHPPAGPDALAADLYAAVLDGRGPLEALAPLAARLGATSHAVHEVREQEGRADRSVSLSHNGLGAAALADYAAHWVREDPWVALRARMPVGVHRPERLLPPGSTERSRIWQEWGRPNDAGRHGLTALLARGPAGHTALVFHRRADAPPFDDAEQGLVEALFPHLQRVFGAHARLAGGQDSAAIALRAGLDAIGDGVALVDPAGRVVFANASLRRMADQRDGIGLSAEGGIEIADVAARQALARAVHAAMAALDGRLGLLPTAGVLAVPRASGGAPWMVRALPARDIAAPGAPPGFRGVVLVVTDQQKRQRPNAAVLGRLFGLTPAEAALAAALAAGRSPAEHAATRGIARDTVRSHLTQVMRKTGCRRQAELAALLARLPG